jgi:O-antigen ligase
MGKSNTASYLFVSFLFLYAFSGILKWIIFFIDPTLLFAALCFVAIMLAFNTKVLVLENPLNNVIGLVLLLHLCILVSMSYTVSDRYYLIKTGKIFFNLVGLLAPLFILRSRNSFEIFKKCCWLALSFALLLLFFELFNNSLTRIRFQDDIPGETNPFPDYMSLSYFLGTMTLLLIDMKNNKKIILLLFAFMFMLLLAAKGPILFLFLSIIAMYWKQIKFFKLKTFFIGLSSVILFVGISFATGSSIFGNLIGRLMFFSEGIEADQSSLGRLVLFGKALELIAESPILGVGIGGFSKAIGGEDGRLSPHNIFLELWVEVGILPLIILFALIIFLTVKYRKLLKVFPDYMGKSIISICLYMFFGLLVSSYLEDLRLTYFWIGVSIAYFALLYREKKYVRN